MGRHTEPMFRDEEAHKYVSHFTGFETFEKHIMPKCRLRMSRFDKVNDPRESQVWNFGLSVRPELEDFPWELEAIADRFTSYLKGNAKLLCVTQDDPLLHPNRHAHLYGRCYAHPSMWDRYAARHSGVCLTLDKKKLHDAVEQAATARGQIISAPICYADQPQNADRAFHLYADETAAIADGREPAVFQEHQRAHLDAFYFWKSLDWSSEFEYRWVLLDSRAEDVYVDISGALSGVMFGASTPDEDADRVVAALADWEILCCRLLYSNGHPIVFPHGPQRCARFHFEVRDTLRWSQDSPEPLTAAACCPIRQTSHVHPDAGVSPGRLVDAGGGTEGPLGSRGRATGVSS